MNKILISIMMISMCLHSDDFEVDEHRYYAGGFHYIVHAHMNSQLEEARVYFKNIRAKTYEMYVKMDCEVGECYASLPVSTPELKALEYLVAYKTKEDEIYSSGTHESIKRDMLELPLWQRGYQDLNSDVYTEYEDTPTIIKGFKMDFEIYFTDIDDIFGTYLGLYELEDIQAPTNVFDKDVCSQCEMLELDEL